MQIRLLPPKITVNQGAIKKILRGIILIELFGSRGLEFSQLGAEGKFIQGTPFETFKLKVCLFLFVSVGVFCERRRIQGNFNFVNSNIITIIRLDRFIVTFQILIFYLPLPDTCVSHRMTMITHSVPVASASLPPAESSPGHSADRSWARSSPCFSTRF